MNKTIIILSSIVFLISSCNNKHDKTTNMGTTCIFFSRNMDTLSLKTSDLFSGYSIFRLNDSILEFKRSDIAKFGKIGDNYLVSTNTPNNSTLRLYDKEGNYKHDIGDIGRARNEHYGVNSFCVNEDSTVTISDKSKAIINYSINGEFNWKQSTNEMCTVEGYYSDSTLLVSDYNIFTLEDYMFQYNPCVLLDKDSCRNIILQYIPSEKTNTIKQVIRISDYIYKYKNNYQLYYYPDKTIYELQDSGQVARYKLINLDEDDKLTESLLSSFMGIMENDRYIIFPSSYVYDKEEGKCYNIKLIDDMILPHQLGDNKKLLKHYKGSISMVSVPCSDTSIKEYITTLGDNKHKLDDLKDILSLSRSMMSNEEWEQYKAAHPKVMKIYDFDDSERLPRSHMDNNPVLLIYTPKEIN